VVHKVCFEVKTPGQWAKKLDDVMWTLHFLHDLEYDLSAIHRVEDMYAMPSRKFFRFANRIVEHEGSMTRLRHKQVVAKGQQPQQTEPRPLYAPQPALEPPRPAAAPSGGSQEDFMRALRMREGSVIMTPTAPN
jgi:hypothetical protein